MKEYYSPADFFKTQKYDAHIHYHTFNNLFVRKANNNNIRLLTINTNFDFFPMDTQFEISQLLHKKHPQSFDFISTFDATPFTSKTFADDTVEHIKKCMAAGARGIKIWKNIGMALKNDDGQYVMADDPVFDPIFTFLQKEKIPLLAHLGEPRNCWLPLEQMTAGFGLKYYNENPNHHMYLHPEVPSYEQQIIARDRILERYPELVFVGAHLGSMEWNLEEVAKRFERHQNFYVDISGRFNYILEQTLRSRNYVIDFFETYQNRILYGSDCFVSQYNSRKWMHLFCKCFPQLYMNLLFGSFYRTVKNNWLFFATDKIIKTEKMYIEGLKLSKNIVDKIFYENTRCLYYRRS